MVTTDKLFLSTPDPESNKLSEPRPTNTNLLLQIVQDIAEIKATVKNYADLELRVRELEKARWSSAWLTGLLSAGISGGLVAVIIKVIGG